MSSVPATYKAYVYDAYGPIEDVLQLAEIPTEPLPRTHVRIQVHSAAINPIDWKIVEVAGPLITGGSPSVDKPYGIGFDVAGVVAQVGADVQRFQIGDHVFATAPTTGFGTIAEYFSIDAQFVAMKPTSVGFDQAASVPLVALTTYQALVETAKIQSGETLVVLGGTTSTGLFGIQYAKSIGARVVATTSAKNVAFVQSLGADLVVDYTSQQWTDVLDEHSVDVVLDNGVDPESWDANAQTVLRKDTGRFVTLLPMYQPGPPKFGATYSSVFARPSGQQLAVVAKLIDEHKIQPILDSAYSFTDAAAAFARSKTGRAVGKIVLTLLP